MPQIPKTHHFIWLGARLPDKYIHAFSAWIIRNPDFTYKIWTDRIGSSRADIEIIQQRIREDLTLKIRTGEFTLPGGSTNLDEFLAARVESHDINDDPRFATPEVRYEIDRLRPNYGAASDLLRYRILSAEGGMYTDFDVDPPEAKLAESCIWWREHRDETAVYITGLNDGLLDGRWANDILISPPDAPAMLALCDETRRNYAAVAEEEITDFTAGRGKPEALVYFSELPDEIAGFTLARTGPYVLSSISKKYPTQVIKVAPVTLRMPTEKSDMAWCGRGVRLMTEAELTATTDPIENAIACIINQARFEIDHLHIFRLEQYITDFIGLLDKIRLFQPDIERDKTTLIDRLIQNLRRCGLNYEAVHVTQLTFLYPETIVFYKENHLMDKTMLSLRDITEEDISQCKFIFSAIPFIPELREYHITLQAAERHHQSLKDVDTARGGAAASGSSEVSTEELSVAQKAVDEAKQKYDCAKMKCKISFLDSITRFYRDTIVELLEEDNLSPRVRVIQLCLDALLKKIPMGEIGTLEMISNITALKTWLTDYEHSCSRWFCCSRRRHATVPEMQPLPTIERVAVAPLMRSIAEDDDAAVGVGGIERKTETSDVSRDDSTRLTLRGKP